MSRKSGSSAARRHSNSSLIEYRRRGERGEGREGKGRGGEATRVNNENINEPWIYYFSLFVPLFVSLPLYRILLDGTEDRKCFNGTRQVENRAGDTWPPTLWILEKLVSNFHVGYFPFMNRKAYAACQKSAKFSFWNFYPIQRLRLGAFIFVFNTRAIIVLSTWVRKFFSLKEVFKGFYLFIFFYVFLRVLCKIGLRNSFNCKEMKMNHWRFCKVE